MIPSSQNPVPFDMRHPYEAAQPAPTFNQQDPGHPGIAVRYRIPTAGYVPPVTYDSRTRPLPLPVPVPPAGGPPPSESWNKVVNEARVLETFFGASLSRPPSAV